jgi:hypothetical protein
MFTRVAGRVAHLIGELGELRRWGMELEQRQRLGAVGQHPTVGLSGVKLHICLVGAWESVNELARVRPNGHPSDQSHLPINGSRRMS